MKTKLKFKFLNLLKMLSLASKTGYKEVTYVPENQDRGYLLT